MDPIRTCLQREDFDLGAEHSRIKSVSKRIGGLVTFIGVARNESGDKKVVSLEFEAYGEMAERELRSMAEEAAARFGLIGLTILHRLGPIPSGENIVLIMAAAAHRREAFQGAEWCIDELKRRIPIWKKEIFTDGQEWVEGPA